MKISKDFVWCGKTLKLIFVNIKKTHPPVLFTENITGHLNNVKTFDLNLQFVSEKFKCVIV